MTKSRITPPLAKGAGGIKAPGTQTQGSTQHLYPVFCLRYLGNFEDCQQKSQAALGAKLCTLAKMTWQDITNAPRHGLGHEKIPVKQLNVTVPPALANEEFVLAFRFDGKAPMLGVREGATLRIFHLDHDFTAYPHG